MTDFANTPTVISVTVFLNKKGNKMRKLILGTIIIIQCQLAFAAQNQFQTNGSTSNSQNTISDNTSANLQSSNDGTANNSNNNKGPSQVQCTGENKAYKDVSLTECIECNTTEFQGITTIDGINYCVKCNEDTQTWDNKNKKCVTKDEYIQISSETMKRCWQCPNNETFKTCAIILSLPDTDQQKHPQYTTTMQDCKITGQ